MAQAFETLPRMLIFSFVCFSHHVMQLLEQSPQNQFLPEILIHSKYVSPRENRTPPKPCSRILLIIQSDRHFERKKTMGSFWCKGLLCFQAVTLIKMYDGRKHSGKLCLRDSDFIRTCGASTLCWFLFYLFFSHFQSVPGCEGHVGAHLAFLLRF